MLYVVSLLPVIFSMNKLICTMLIYTYSFNELACGGRLCTCLVYLNDSEQSQKESAADNDREGEFSGGQTEFPEFNTAVEPKKGSCLFFWNCIEKPGSAGYHKDMFLNVDIKLRHAGLPVIR